MNKGNDILIEYGEIARKPIGKYTLIKHWLAINKKAMAADRGYKFIFYNGSFYELNDYSVKEHGNKYISEIKLVKYI